MKDGIRSYMAFGIKLADEIEFKVKKENVGKISAFLNGLSVINEFQQKVTTSALIFEDTKDMQNKYKLLAQSDHKNVDKLVFNNF